ncbi:DNA polymerase III subunit beta [Rhodoluna lacicola]|uniref:DNA polymerase III subunit beta n=1 Tax=Rhodoluna lacicola TaxID=529884 RepID=UPI002231C5FB|nr:DNA polymerase III subunit beta [Rhodoluna lacicola]BDS49740.1 DNA polymerase III subunit beta [Rhodoluna lacicola]
MKFQVNKDVLSEAVSFAVRLLPQRTTLPILGGILIEADANALRLSVFDYEVSAQAEIVAKVEESGRVLVSGRLLSEIASKLPNAPVEFATDGSKVTVSCGSTKFSLLTMPVDEYPTLPEIPLLSGTISGEAFANAVGQIAVAASKDDVTPVLTGVQIEASEKTLSFVATDRYRVALCEASWNGSKDADGSVALVPARTLQEVAKTFGNQGDIQISIAKTDDREMIAFKANNRSVTSLLLKGNFPPVKSLFPAEIENYAVVATQDLIDSTRRVSLVLEREAPLRYSFDDGKVSMEATGNETAQASENISAELEGKEIVVSLKPQFLIDGLAGVHSEFVKIAFTNNENPNKPGPVLISSHGSKEKTAADSYRYLLQPNLLVR